MRAGLKTAGQLDVARGVTAHAKSCMSVWVHVCMSAWTGVL